MNEKQLDLVRFWLHFPVGVIAGILSIFTPVVGITFTALFCYYEVMNDWRKKDWSYKDVYGFVWGFALPAIIWCGFIISKTLGRLIMSG